MSDQQYIWQPITNELIHIHDAASVDQYEYGDPDSGTYLEVNSAGDAAGVRLPDDLRLCRRAPVGVGVANRSAD